MFKKNIIANFIVLFLPILGISTLFSFLYSMNSQDNTHINWFIVILFAIVLDAFVTWMQTRKDNEKNPNNSVN